MTLRPKIETAFEAWGRWVYRYPLRTITVVLIGVAALGTRLPALSFETSLESFLHVDDPLRLRYEDFRRQFGRDDLVIVAIEAPDVYALEFLERLRALHRDLELEVPYLDEVTSLVNARETRGEVDRLVVGELMEDWPDSPEALASVKLRATANRLYQNFIVSEDGRVAAILLKANPYSETLADDEALEGFDDEPPSEAQEGHRSPYLTSDENAAFVRTIESVVDRYQAGDFRIHTAGLPATSDFLLRTIQRDMMRFTAYGIATIAAFLALLFRRAVAVVLPLSVVILSMLCTLSLMPIFDAPITLPTQILPSFLLAVGVGDSVHILVIFFQRFNRGASKEDAIAFALGHSGLAIVMTSLTTAGALLSFSAAELAPVAVLGLIAPAGVMIALLFSVIMLPALISIFPIRPGRESDKDRARVVRKLLVRCGDFAISHAWPVVLVSAGFGIAACLGVAQLRMSHSPMEWFPEGNRYRIATEFINDELGGAMFLEVLIDTGVENGLHDPERLKKLDRLRPAAMSLQSGEVYAGKTLSLADIVKEINQALNEGHPDAYRVPDDRALVAQELLLFENTGTDDLEDVVDSQFRYGRFTVKLPMIDAVEYAPYLEMLGLEASRVLGEGFDVTFTGLMRIISATIYAMMRTMAQSYLIAFAVITPLMIILIGDLRLGLLSMVPNLAPILLVLGVMGWIGVPLDAFTLLIGSIAIGLAVDDTIHFMHNFRRYYERSGDVRFAVRETLGSTGQALLFTSLVLSTGFFIFTFAALSNLFYFGFLTGLAIVMAFLADVILAPALLALVVGRGAPGSSGTPTGEGAP